jgi:hypothetical protein
VLNFILYSMHTSHTYSRLRLHVCKKLSPKPCQHASLAKTKFTFLGEHTCSLFTWKQPLLLSSRKTSMMLRTFTTWALLLPVLVAGDDFLKDYRRLRSREVSRKTASAIHSERTLDENVKPFEDTFFRLLGQDTSMPLRLLRRLHSDKVAVHLLPRSHLRKLRHVPLPLARHPDRLRSQSLPLRYLQSRPVLPVLHALMEPLWTSLWRLPACPRSL